MYISSGDRQHTENRLIAPFTVSVSVVREGRRHRQSPTAGRSLWGTRTSQVLVTVAVCFVSGMVDRRLVIHTP
jgi:hypothetical protein